MSAPGRTAARLQMCARWFGHMRPRQFAAKLRPWQFFLGLMVLAVVRRRRAT